MKASLKAFERGLLELRQHLAYLEGEKRLFGISLRRQGTTPLEEGLAALATQVGASSFKKQFDYNSVIVALYGFLEQFVESLLKGYLSKLSEVSQSYASLPEAIRGAHIEVTAALLKAPDLQKFRGVVTPEGLTANLHSCLSSQVPFALNVDAFSHHTANFKVPVVDQFFSRIGVTGISSRVVQLLSFQVFLKTFDPARCSVSFDQGCLFEIDDLAERRNEVAHGSSAQLLSNELLHNYVSIVESYGRGLYEVVSGGALAYEVSQSGIPLGSPIAVHHHSIICINLPARTTVKRGDVLVAVLDGGPCPAVGGEILSIEIDHCDIEAISLTVPTNVGFRVGFRAKVNQVFQLLPR